MARAYEATLREFERARAEHLAHPEERTEGELETVKQLGKKLLDERRVQEKKLRNYKPVAPEARDVLQQWLKTVDASSKWMSEKYSDVLQRANTAEGNREQVQKDLEICQGELTEAREQLKTETGTVALRDGQITELSGDIQIQAEELEKLRPEVSRLTLENSGQRENLGTKTKEVERLETELKNANAENKQLKEQVQKLQNRVDPAELAAAQKEANAAKADLAERELSWNQERESLTDDRDGKQTDLQAARETLEELQQALEEEGEKIEHESATVNVLKMQSKRDEKAAADAKEARDEARNDRDLARTDRDEARRDFRSLCLERDAKISECIQLQLRANTAETERDSSKTFHDEKVQRIEQELGAAKMTIGELTGKVAERDTLMNGYLRTIARIQPQVIQLKNRETDLTTARSDVQKHMLRVQTLLKEAKNAQTELWTLRGQKIVREEQKVDLERRLAALKDVKAEKVRLEYDLKDWQKWCQDAKAELQAEKYDREEQNEAWGDEKDALRKEVNELNRQLQVSISQSIDLGAELQELLHEHRALRALADGTSTAMGGQQSFDK